jgi:hypothetical protein
MELFEFQQIDEPRIATTGFVIKKSVDIRTVLAANENKEYHCLEE